MACTGSVVVLSQNILRFARPGCSWPQKQPYGNGGRSRAWSRTDLRRIFMASDTWQPIPTSSLFHAGSRHVARTSGCTGEMLAIVGFNYVDCQ